MLRAGLRMTRGARSLGGGFLCSRGLGGGMSSLIFGIADHHDGDRRSQPTDEMHRHRVLAELADRFLEHHLAAIDLFTDELRQIVGDITRGDGTIQASAFAGAGGELQALAGNLIRQRLKLGFLLSDLAGFHRGIVLGGLDLASGGQHRHPLWDEVVSGETGLHFLNRASLAQLRHILAEYDLHATTNLPKSDAQRPRNGNAAARWVYGHPRGPEAMIRGKPRTRLGDPRARRQDGQDKDSPKADGSSSMTRGVRQQSSQALTGMLKVSVQGLHELHGVRP